MIAVPAPEYSDGEVVVERVLEFGGIERGADYAFYMALDLDVDAAGRVYVYDAGNFRIQVFDESGEFLTTIGGYRGQGPQDLGVRGDITVGADAVVYWDAARRLVTWGLDGEHLRSVRRDGPSGVNYWLQAHAEGPLVGSYVFSSGDDDRATRFRGISAFSPEGELVADIATVAQPAPITVRRSTATSVQIAFAPVEAGEPRFAIARSGQIYVSAPTEYQILSLNVDGGQRWALHADVSRLPISNDTKQEALAYVRETIEDAAAREINWPPAHPALSIESKIEPTRGHGAPIRVDGRDRLFVFPFVLGDHVSATSRPVDVYSSGGELLFSGRMPSISWIAARGDLVYGFSIDESGEQRVIVNRIVLPDL